MARRRLPNGQIIDDGQPAPAPAAPGTTFAKEAQPASGLTLPGGATSTAGAALAAAPTAGFGASPISQPPPYDPARPLSQFASTPASTLPAPIAPPSMMPQVLGGTPEDSAAAVGGALRGVGGQTQAATPGSTLTMFGANGPVQIPTGSTATSLPGNRTVVNGGGQTQTIGGGGPNAVAERSRTVGANGATHITTASGGTVDIPASTTQPVFGSPTGITGAGGQQVVRNSQGQLAPGTPQPGSGVTPPMSYADQEAAILKAYPAVGQAGSQENKLFVDKFKQGGSDTSNVLDLAHSLFAPKTQTGTMAAVSGVTPSQMAADQAAVDAKSQAAARAAMTPAQIAAQQAKQTSNNAQVAAAGQPVLDNASTAKDIGAAIPEGFNALGNNVLGAITGAASGIGNFVSGLAGGSSAAPAASPITTPPPAPATLPAATGAYSSSQPATPTPPTPPSTVPAPIAPPVPGTGTYSLGTAPAATPPATQAAANPLPASHPLAPPPAPSFSPGSLNTGEPGTMRPVDNIPLPPLVTDVDEEARRRAAAASKPVAANP